MGSTSKTPSIPPMIRRRIEAARKKFFAIPFGDPEKYAAAWKQYQRAVAQIPPRFRVSRL